MKIEQPPAPTQVRWAAVIAGVQGLIFCGFAIFYVVETVIATPTRLFGALGGAFLALIAAVSLLALSYGLRRLRRWARSPVIVFQLLFLPVGFSLAFQAGRPLYGVPILAAALGELYLLATPAGRMGFDAQPPTA